MRRFLFAFACLATLVFTCAPCGAADMGDDALMRELCKKFVAENPQYEIVGLGSWIQGNYRPGHSDHDMRLILKDSANMSADDMAASWGEAQRKFAEMGRKELGDKAPDLLKRTNIYAPEKLMQGVENADDAAKLFHKYQITPNVSNPGKSISAEAAKIAAGDGTFGDTAAYRQNYESKAGKVFYGNGKGKAFIGEVDLVHMAEGYGKYSPSALGGTSSTWSRLAAEAMEKGDTKSTAKYLSRIREELRKARDLMRIGADADMDKELRTLISTLEKGSKVNGSVLKSAISRCATQAEFFRTVDLNNPRQARLIASLVEKARWDSSFLGKMGDALNSMGDAFNRVGDAVNKIPVAEIVNVMGQVMDAYSIYAGSEEIASGKRTLAEVLAREVPGLVSLPAGIAATITQAVLDEAEAFGARLMASQQTAENLLAGILTVRGREVNFLSENLRGWTIDEVAEKIHTEAGLDAFVWHLSQRASTKGERTSRYDEAIAKEVFDSCWPKILSMWQDKRREFYMEYLALANKLMSGTYRMTYAPNPAKLKKSGKGYAPLRVRVRVDSSGWGGDITSESLDAHMARMKVLARKLTGDTGLKAGAGIRFETPGGEGGEAWHAYTFTKPGEYPVEAKVWFFVDGERLSSAQGFESLRISESLTVSVTVEVKGEEPKPEPPKTATSAKKGEEAKQEKAKTATPAKAEQKKAEQKKDEECVWVLTGITRHTRSNWRTSDWEYNHVNAGTSFIKRSTLRKERGIKHYDEDKGKYHDAAGSFFEVTLSFSEPPSMIEGGAKVTLQMLIALTGEKACCDRLSWGEWAGAKIDKSGLKPGGTTGAAVDFMSEERKGMKPRNSNPSYNVSCFKRDGVTRKKDSGTFTATMRKGSKPGEQRSIYLHAMEAGLGTEYTYTWTPRSEAKVRKITPREKPAPKGSLINEEKTP